MTGQPLRPEEHRSLVEQHPEIIGQQIRPGSPHDKARALVGSWQNGLAIRQMNKADPLGLIATLTLTQDVEDRMVADITALLNDTISREHNTP